MWDNLKSRAYSKEYYDEHKNSGLNYLGHGGWQINYAKWLIDCLHLENCLMLDVGCACGSIVKGFVHNNVNCIGMDLSEYMINLGREAWPELELYICDAVNLHYFSDEQFDMIHSAQVAEHWKPELVTFILQEMRRVSKVNSLFFCCMDTLELYERQNRKPETEDPTHYCIMPMSWWHAQFANNRWEVVTHEYFNTLKEHKLSYLKSYDWDFVIARAV